MAEQLSKQDRTDIKTRYVLPIPNKINGIPKGFTKAKLQQVKMLRTEFNKDEFKQLMRKRYILAQKDNGLIRLIENEYYIIAFDVDDVDDVLVYGSSIIEHKQDDGYTYYKIVDFVLNIEQNILLYVRDKNVIEQSDTVYQTWKEAKNYIIKKGGIKI